MNSSEGLVRFEHVQKSYDGVTLVVKDLNLRIAEGEFLTMLGPSGSGKTTCLMMLAGFETATQGEIYIKDRSINRVPPHKRNIGMVFQNYALFPHMTVAENLAYPLKVKKLGKSEIESKVQQALGMIQMREFASRRPGMLSGGQQQRVAVARALVFDPDIVLMDEPLGALDKQLREQMQFEIKSIHQNLGITAVYVTHDQSEALTMSDRIAVFNEGVIQQLSTPEDLYERPNNAFVAQFIGENNKLHGSVKSIEKDSCEVQLDDGSVVRAARINVNQVGEKSTLSLRPERIEVNPVNGNYPNMYEGQVQELIYLGDHIRTRVTLCGHDDFVVKIPNSARHATLRNGDSAQFGWSVEDCRALDG